MGDDIVDTRSLDEVSAAADGRFVRPIGSQSCRARQQNERGQSLAHEGRMP